MSAIKDWKKVQCVVSENPADFVEKMNELVEAGYMVEDIGSTEYNCHCEYCEYQEYFDIIDKAKEANDGR